MNTSRNAWIPRLTPWKNRLGRHHASPPADFPSGLSPTPRHIEIPSPPGGEATAVAIDDAPASPAQAGPPRETDAGAATAGAVARAGDRVLDGPAPPAPASPPSREISAGTPAPAASHATPAIASPRTATPHDAGPQASRSRADPDSPSAGPDPREEPSAPGVAAPRPRTLDAFAETAQESGRRPQGLSVLADGHAATRESPNSPSDPGGSDLSRTNELLEQILAETRRRAVAYLPASGPGWNR